jgi:sporadic carbohydrate cluster 2OG-Fe(II) oxygenase
MINDNFISTFNDKNYLIFGNQNSLTFNIFYEEIYNVICQEVGLNDIDLSDLHNYISSEDVNKIRMKVFRRLNSIPDWEEKYYALAASVLKEMFGPDISIQIKLNFSIQLPDDENSILALHTDTLSGQSPYECVLWTAITDAFDSNAMYIFDKITSKQLYNELPNYQYLGMNNLFDDYKSKLININARKGECVLFSSTLFHGNQLNKTDKTRISMNCRFKSLFSPEYSDKPHERVTGQFYKKLFISPITRIGLSYNDKIKF